MPKTKILLVDDHVMITEGLKLALNSQKDFKVIGTAHNGLEAIEKVKKLSPDVVLMDINMPQMNGIEAAGIIKIEYPSTKVIMLTMMDNQKFIIDAMSCGIDGYIYKDADIKELVKAIYTVVEGKEYLNQEVTEKILSYFSGKKRNFGKTKEIQRITPRELEVIKLVAQGLTSKVVADKLFISELTVIKHRKNIIRKLGVKNFTEVVAFAIQNGLI